MASIPKTMNAIRFDRLGGPEVLQYVSDEPVPTLKDGEILVRNEFVGVNFIDTYFRSGVYKAPLPQLDLIKTHQNFRLHSINLTLHLHDGCPNDRAEVCAGLTVSI
jgi:hypothetical protein